MGSNKLSIFLAVVLMTGSGAAQERSNLSSGPRNVWTFTEVKGQPENPVISSFEFSSAGYKYRISVNGRGTRRGKAGGPRAFNLRLKQHDSLERAVYYAEYQGDLLLLCEVSDGEGGAGFITRLDGRTLRTKWKRWIPAFNVGQGFIEDDFAYVTAIGFVGKVDLKSGAFVWKHDDLFRGGSRFTSFELPKIEGATILFKEETIYSEPAKTIKVDKQTGRIINVS
jgi:hypothetical protein